MCFSTSRLNILLVFACATALPLFGQSGAAPSPATVALDGRQVRHVLTVNQPAQVLQIDNLIQGETYSLIIPEDPALGTCHPNLQAADAATQVLRYDEAARQLVFVANQAAVQFQLKYPCSWSADNPPRHYISIVCETCVKKDLQAYMESLAATLQVEGGQSAEDLIKDVLIGGNCFDITNVTFTGNAGQIGTFSNGATNIGFNRGVIMATGDISLAPGPNDQDGASAGYGSSTPDGDLGTLTGGALFDMANIEFDFTPTQTPLTFNFVFASEEYCEYVGTQYNDVFGFFISGPGIAGGQQNIALIPLTTIPVAINNVNHLSYSGLYVNNQPASSGNLCGQSPSFSPVVNEIQYDGYTRKFTALANVQPCQTYHIKLKIADVGDGVWDSAVFLNAGSFDAGGNASVEWEVDGDPDDEDVFEGCGKVELVFRRVGGNAASPMTVQYTVTGTATPGLDYSVIPPVIVIPAGQMEYRLTVNILTDALLEGLETVIITLANPCSCLNPQETLKILDLPVLQVLPDTVTICGAGAGTVSVTVVDGVEPYTYLWQNGSTDPTTTVFVGTSSNVRVTVTDACGKTKVATARIIVNPLPRAQLIPPAPQICPGADTQIKIQFTGNGPFDLEYMINGDPQPPIYGISDNPFFLTVNQPGVYQLIGVTDSLGCQGPGLGLVVVVESTLALTGVATNVQCSSSSNGSINTTVTGGSGPFTYTWTGPIAISNQPDPINLPPGDYNVTVTDGSGCTDDGSFSVIAPNPLTTTIANVNGTNCANPNVGSINLEVTGGFPNYTYKWTNGSSVQDPSGLAAGIYTVTVTDLSGCSKTTTATVPGDFDPPAASATVNGQLTCQVASLTLNGSASSIGPNFTYLWTANPGNIVSGSATLNPVVNQAGNYTLVITNTSNGCTASSTAPVVANTTLPAAEAGPVQTITCALPNAALDGTGSSTGANFSYQWTAGPGGSILSGAGTLNPVVGTAGTYTLLVTNTQTGCTQTDNVAVGLNITAPTAAVAPPGTLTCTVSQVTLNGSATPAGGAYAYQWTTINGNIQSGQASSNAVVTEAGDYTLIVTNTQNGCTDDATVTVTLDFTDPAAIIVVNNQITCTNKTVTIDATQSSNGALYSFFWATTGGGHIASGSNTLTPTVDAPGFYSLFVTNLFNNCTASASVQVTQNTTPPIVNPGLPGTLNCDVTEIELGDPATIVLPNITYQWTSSPGGNIVSGANTPSILVNQPATYSLLVTNTQNGCTAAGSTPITQNIAPPNAAEAAPGEINCVTPTLLLNGAGSSSGANFTYQWSTTNGNIAAGGATLTPTINSAGNYTLVVTNNANGCTSSASATVTANLAPPTVAIAQPALITCFQPQQTLNGAGSSTGSAFQYQWGTLNGQILSGANSLQPVIGQAGVYTLLVTNTGNSCTSSASITVSADVALPVSNAGQSQVLNCTTTSLTLNGSGSSQGAGFTYLWTAINGGNILPPANILNPSVDAPGTYQLLVTNTQNGCTSASAVQILEDAADPVVQVATPGILNCTDSQVTLNGAGSSTGNNFVYAWSGPGIVSGNSTLNATVSQPGNYTLLITNSDNGCTSLKTVSVQRDIQPPSADAGADNILNCYFPQLQIGGAGSSSGPDFTYSWTGPGIVSGGNTANPVVGQAGLYNLLVTNTANGCTATDNISLSVDQVLPQADAGPGFQLTCTETSYVLAATATQGPDITYKWATNTGNFLAASNILNPEINGAGFYFLTVTNTTNGCTATDLVQITQSADFPTADAGVANTLTCSVNSLTLNGGNSSTGPEFSYLWTPVGNGNIVSGPNTLTPVIDQPGTYQLAVTNNTNNCISYSSIAVQQDVAPPGVEAGNPQTLTCTLSSITLDGQVTTNGNFLYNWQSANGGIIVSGGNTLSPAVSAVGIYTLTVTNTLNGCTAADNVEVLADQSAPVIQIAQPAILNCLVKQTTLNATGSSTGNVQYNWTTANGNFTNLNDPLQPVVNQPGTYTFSITNQDNGCVTSEDIVVSQDIVVPVADAGAIQTLTCALTTLQLNGSNSSQTGGPYFYQWTTPNGAILSGANTLAPTVSAPGGYALLVQNTANGCTATDQVQVVQNIQQPTVVIANAAPLTCAIQQVTLDGSASSTGPNYSYAWTTANGNLIGNQNSLLAQANTEGLYTLTVLDNINGCSHSTDVQVTSNTVLPNADAGPPFTLTCSVEEVTLQAFASAGQQFAYVWTTSGGQIVSGANTLTPKVDKAGVYTLVVTNNDTGCIQTDDVEVFKENNVPTDFVFEVQRPSCKDNDGMIMFREVTGGYGPYLYSINNGQSYAAQVDFANIAPGAYDLWVQDANGCEFYKKLIVPATPDPGISIDPEFNIVLGDSLQLKAVLPPGYSLALVDTVIWTPLEGLTFAGADIFSLLRPYAKPFKPTEYTVRVISIDGCEASDRVLIRVDNEPHIYIPNAFSPWDEDAENDIVLIFADGDQVVQVNSFQIFDRWGNMVFQEFNFQPNDPHHGWNGFHDGKLMTPAVFVYYAEIELIDGRKLLYKGDITLVR
ncbi:MAG: choice-of-anchor L domain-containing protein [Saprospirales bacterium]|nr:choice-of-anchor L domain-containing protein [Saprospirales bacterium]